MVRKIKLLLLLLGLGSMILTGSEVIYELEPTLATGDITDNDKLLGADLRLRSSSGTSFQEILPTLNGAYAGNPTSGVLSIRGINQDGLFGGVGAETNPLVTVFEDGIPLSTNTLRYLATPVMGMDSLTLRRGPTNYSAGPASLAGSLLFSSGSPSFDFSGRSIVEFSEDRTLTGYLEQNLTLIPAELALRLSYYHTESDGQADAAGLPDFSSFDRDRLKLDLLWHPGGNEDQSLLFTFLNDRSGGNPQANTTIIPGSLSLYDRQSLVNTPSSYPAERWAASLRGKFQLPGDILLETTSGFQTVDLGQNLDFDGSPQLNWTIDGDIRERIVSQSVMLSAERGVWAWETGGYFENSRYQVDYSGVGIAPFPAGSPYRNSANTDLQTFAIYGKLSRELANDFTLTAGLRFQHDDRDLDGSSAFGPLPARQSSMGFDDDVVLPSLELAWSPNVDTSVSLSIAKGHRAGGVAYAPIAGIAGKYDAESSWEIELSAEQVLRDNIRLSAALFYSKIGDQQVGSNIPGGLPGVDLLITNVAKSHRYGAEVEARWEPMVGLSLFSNAAWLHTEFDELSLNGIDRSGQKFPNAPELTAAVGVDYRHDSGFFASGVYTWSDSTYSTIDDPGVSALEHRSLLNARVGYSWENASIYVFGNNLLNDEYALYRGLPIPPAIPQVGKAGSSRMVGVGMEFTW